MGVDEIADVIPGVGERAVNVVFEIDVEKLNALVVERLTRPVVGL